MPAKKEYRPLQSYDLPFQDWDSEDISLEELKKEGPELKALIEELFEK